MPSSEQRADAPRRVKYELVMLFNARTIHDYSMLKTSQTEGNDREFWRACWAVALESFLVHYRNLKNFLNNQNPRFADDVLAQHYCEKWNGTSNVTETALDEGDRINQLLMHLSYTRLDLNPGAWDVANMEKNLATSLRSFLNSLDDTSAELFECVQQVLISRAKPLTSRQSSASTETVQSFDWWSSYS